MKPMTGKMAVSLLLAITSLTANAQTTITAVVKDSLTNEAEAYATVRVFKAQNDEKPLGVAITDAQGRLNMTVGAVGDCLLRVSALGRKELVKTMTLPKKGEIDLGALLLATDNNTLSGVTVTAQKPIVKMEVDKMTYDMEADADTKSNTVLDMLRKMPLVTVDGEDNISVNGSGNFKVYVNGKPNVMMSKNPSKVFKMMPAAGIKNIEVITQPGAKYDAEGVGGVLNLVMESKSASAKNSADNSMLTLRGMFGTRDYGGGAYGAMQKGKLSMSLNVSSNQNIKEKVHMDTEREQIGAAEGQTLSTHTDMSQKYNFTNADFSVGYEIDSVRLVTANFGIDGLFAKVIPDMLTSVSRSSLQQSLSYTTAGKEKVNETSLNGGLDYQRISRRNKLRTLTLSYRISTDPERTKSWSRFADDDDSQQWFDLTDRYSYEKTNTVEHTAQIDYTSPIGKLLTLDTGMKFISRNNKSQAENFSVDGDEYTPQESSDIDYRHLNDILAGYAQASLKLKRLSLKAGLRYEHTWQKVSYLKGEGNDYSLDYGNLVPSGNLSWSISDKMNAGLTYSMRISRPGIYMLNPYVDREDPTALSYGNPDLEAAKQHNMNAIFNYFTRKLNMNVNLGYIICNNAFSSYSFYDGDGLLNTTYGNIRKNRSVGLRTYINWSITSTTRLTANMSGRYDDMRSDALGYHNYGFSGSISGGVQQTLPDKWRVAVNAYASSKNFSLMGENSGFSLITCSVNKSLLNDKLNLSLGGVMPFNGKYYKSHSATYAHDYIVAP